MLNIHLNHFNVFQQRSGASPFSQKQKAPSPFEPPGLSDHYLISSNQIIQAIPQTATVFP